MKEEINQYVKNLMDVFTNIIFTRNSELDETTYNTLKDSYNNLSNLANENNIQNPSLLEFISIVDTIFTSYSITSVDAIVGTLFDTDFMLVYNLYAKLKTLAAKIYNNKYNTRKI